MKKRTRRKQERGFALFLIVLIVALVAVTGGTLLDMVNVDLVISGEHRKSASAHANAVGGVLETIGDETLTPANMPIDPSVPMWRYADDSGPIPIRDPTGTPTPMTEANSAFVRNVGQVFQESYTSDISLLRIGPAFDTSVDQASAILYEVRSVSNVNSGGATKEVRAEIYRIVQGAGARQLEGANGLHTR